MRKTTLCIILSIALLLCACNSKDKATNTVTLVQNGYLGEYTDITVKEILDYNYGILYETSVWDSGTTDDGSEIVQVQYYNEADAENGVTIQFKMLDKQCFKISAFVDPMETIEESTDLMAVVNNLYLLSYVNLHRSEMEDTDKANAFIRQLDEISGSVALYGAAANYQGNRSQICQKDGSTAMDLSVPWLLDQYGMLDMSEYEIPGDSDVESSDDETTDTPPLETEVDETAIDALKAVMCGTQAFLNNETQRYDYIDKIVALAGDTFDDSLVATQFAVVDMDQDGTVEAVVELTDFSDGWILVLRYQDGNVYGYGFSYRAMTDLRTDGTLLGSSGADDSSYYRLMFRGYDIYEHYVPNPEVLAEPAEWYEFIYRNIDAYFKN